MGLGLSVKKLIRTAAVATGSYTQYSDQEYAGAALSRATPPKVPDFQRRPRSKLPLIRQLNPRVPAAVAHQDRA